MQKKNLQNWKKIVMNDLKLFNETEQIEIYLSKRKKRANKNQVTSW